MNHLGYVDPYNPNQPLAHRPPGYPTLIFALMYIGGESFPKLLVAAQCLLLAATATITARMAEIVAPRFGFIAFCLMLFNPNSFGTAFFVQSETLHALLVTLAAWSLMIYSAKPSIAMAAAIGLSIGTACLVRSDCQLLVVMIPPVLFVFAITTLPTHRLAKGLFYACVFLAVVSLVTMPWMIRNQMIGEGYRLTAGGSLSYYLWGGGAEIEMVQSGVSNRQAERHMSELREKIKAQYGDSWAALSDQEKNGVLSRGAVEQIQSYDLSSIATNIGLATLQFNLAGGSGRLFALAGQPETAPFAFMVRNERSGYFESVLGALGEADLSLLLIWVLAMGYVVIARIVGMFGVYGLLREKQYANLFIIVSGICYFALIFPFFGISRFRVNVESLFVVLFVAGLFFLRHRRSGRPGL